MESRLAFHVHNPGTAAGTYGLSCAPSGCGSARTVTVGAGDTRVRNPGDVAEAYALSCEPAGCSVSASTTGTLAGGQRRDISVRYTPQAGPVRSR